MKSSLFELLQRPILTEKTTELAKFNQYVFEVRKDANKIELAKAFELAFEGRKVKAVRLVKIPAKTRRMGRRTVEISERRKAIFTIEGEPLEMITGV